ncbi:primase/helicase [Alteromonas phage vB_AcoS-R7M]|uniref:Primase/helicase n=1 Tax=Alteromonas phage vB_AcoS-R7M TaxID=2729541 RepID=A0A6M3YNH0_9CAUD|nr:DNA primase [Alteromonas phage vB_AcoS-R7M]QJI53387.1 primase/helicase [Alteromonas phage vB_AcoS-R7M]
MTEVGNKITRLPNGLQQRQQWCVAGPDKAPYVEGPNGLYRASPVKGPWLTFTQACELAEKHGAKIGYILTKDDPFTCIDLDIKDANSKDAQGNYLPQHKWTTPGDLLWYEGIVQAANSYTEMSSSGKGIHVWVEATIPEGRRDRGIEVYSAERFIICTGNEIESVKYQHLLGVAVPSIKQCEGRPIANRQRLVESIVGSFGTAGAKIELEEVDQVLPDQEIWERASTAGNAEKFVDLCNGNWHKYNFPSQSEADLALMSMFTFYSESNEQCRRMFRLTALGKREKAVKNDVYLDRTLKIIRGRQETEKKVDIKIDAAALALKKQIQEEVVADRKPDVSALINKLQMQALEAGGPSTEQQLVDSLPQPPEVEGISWPPGVMGAIASFVYNSAQRPVKEVAIAAALGFMAGVAGKTYVYNETGLNLYLILIARSGIGKEALHSGISYIMRNIGSRTPAGQEFVMFSDFASGPALMKACNEFQSFINVSGEWGRKLKRLAAEDGRDGAMAQLRTVMTNLYSKSGPASIVGGINYSNSDNNVAALDGINYSMVGETTPGTFYESLTPSMMEDGFLSRFNLIEYTGGRPPPNENIQTVMHPDFANHLTSIVINSKKLIEQHQHIEVQMSPESKKALDEFNQLCDDKINEAGDNEMVRQMWNRAHLKALRVSCLLAVADNFVAPVVMQQHSAWALELIHKDLATMKNKIEGGDIGLDDDSRMTKLISILKDYLKGKVPASYNIDKKLIDQGIVPRRYLQVRTSQVNSFVKHRLGSTAALDQVIRAALDNGYIMEVDRTKLIDNFGSFGRCFRIIVLPTT